MMNLGDRDDSYLKGESARISGFIANFVEDNDYDGVVLGMSGGLDSSVTAALCVRALSSDRVKALVLPERDSSGESVNDAISHAKGLGVAYEVIDLTDALEELGCYESAASTLVRFKGVKKAVSLLPRLARRGLISSIKGGGTKQFKEFTAFYRMKHRLRMVVLYKRAEEKNLAVVSCANRTEYQTGFFVKYGDDSGDIAPIRHLYKSDVRKLGNYLSIPERILDKAPSPDLFAGVGDEEVMGITYDRLDRLLVSIDDGLDEEEIEQRTGEDPKTVQFVKEMVENSVSMRCSPATLSVDGDSEDSSEVT